MDHIFRIQIFQTQNNLVDPPSGLLLTELLKLQHSILLILEIIEKIHTQRKVHYYNELDLSLVALVVVQHEL